MKLRAKELLQKYYHIILLISYFIIQLILHNYIYLYGDDFFYGTFIRDNFWEKHLEHYMYVNGRAMIHFLVSIVTAFDVYLFRVLNPLIIIGLIIFTAKFVSNDKKTYQIAIVGGIVLFSLLSINITRQSVYWLDGSFNYLLPCFLSITALYFVRKSISARKYSFYVTIMVLLASITVEQLSVITFGGILLMMILNILIKKDKIDSYCYIYLITSLIGICTIIFAPGTFTRAEIQGEVNILTNIKQLVGLIFLTRDVLVYHMLIALSIIFWFIHQKKRSVIYKALLIGNCSYVILSFIVGYKMSNLTFFAFPNKIILYIYLLCIIFYVMSIIYYAISNLFIEKDERILMSFILAGGAQFMLIISPVYGYRTLLCSIIVLYIPILIGIINFYNKKYFISFSLMVCSSYFCMPIIFILALLITFMEKINSSKLIEVNRLIKACMILLIISIPMYDNINGYKTNSICNEYNINAIKKYKEQGSKEDTIYLKKMTLYKYGWSYPYENRYHMLVYKMYYDINEDVTIKFE